MMLRRHHKRDADEAPQTPEDGPATMPPDPEPEPDPEPDAPQDTKPAGRSASCKKGDA
jgi:hypothetical protein